MRLTATMKQRIFVVLALMTFARPAASAADTPAYMQAISGPVTSSPAETATKNVLALNTAMFGLYDAAGRVFQKNILAQHPVILGLFSGAGGRFILYRPGMAPLEAPLGANRLSADEIGRTQRHGAERSRHAIFGQRGEPVLARASLGLSQPDANGPRYAGRHRHAGRLAGHQPYAAAEQHCVHGRVRREAARFRWPTCKALPASRRHC